MNKEREAREKKHTSRIKEDSRTNVTSLSGVGESGLAGGVSLSWEFDNGRALGFTKKKVNKHKPTILAIVPSLVCLIVPSASLPLLKV